ncbi:MAG TPA: WYL domain-containing protein [Nocardioides sp.]
MSVGAKEQVGRLLALVPLIQREGSMNVADAANRLGVDPEQLVKDLRVLIYCGWPGWMPGDLIEVDLDALDGESMIHIHNADYFSAPLRLSTAEASAITVALRTLREVADEETTQSLDRALAKIEAVAEDGQATPAVDVHVPVAQRESAALRHQLDKAMSAGKQVRLGYHVPARDENTERVVDPVAIVDRQGMAYLRAWCHQANSQRLFRLDRVVAAETLDSPVEEHPELEADDLPDELFRPSPQSPLITLRLDPQARWVAEYYPIEASRELPDGGLEVDLRSADPRWLLRLVLRLAPHARILGPQADADTFAQAAGETLSLYTGSSA